MEEKDDCKFSTFIFSHLSFDLFSHNLLCVVAKVLFGFGDYLGLSPSTVTLCSICSYLGTYVELCKVKLTSV